MMILLEGKRNYAGASVYKSVAAMAPANESRERQL